MDPEAIEREALELPLSDRAALAHKLLISLENISESEHDQLWLDEAARRTQDIDEGRVELISSEEVSRKARALLK